MQFREDPRSTPGFYGPWSFKIWKSWSLIRSKMANFWLLLKLWQSKSSFPSISNDILDLIYLIRYYLPIHKMHCMWMYCKSKVKVFGARLCNLLEKDWQHSRLDTWLVDHPFCVCKFMSFKLHCQSQAWGIQSRNGKKSRSSNSFHFCTCFGFLPKKFWQIPFRGLWPLTHMISRDLQRFPTKHAKFESNLFYLDNLVHSECHHYLYMHGKKQIGFCHSRNMGRNNSTFG